MKRIILIMVLMTALFTGQLMAFMYANGTCKAYDDCEWPEGARAAGSGCFVKPSARSKSNWHKN